MRIFVLGMVWAGMAAAQQQEVGLLLGGVLSDAQEKARLSAGSALQANYGHRLKDLGKVALYGEVHFLANAQRTVGSGVGAATRDVASLYVTPGVRVKFRPGARVAPYVAVGAGWALYEQSLTSINGQPNAAPRTVSRGALGFGVGADFAVAKWLALRGEVRDFYSGRPVLNVGAVKGGQHNVVVSGGLVLRFR